MFAFPCDAEGFTARSPATRRRSESSQSTPDTSSSAGSSESTASPTSAGPAYHGLLLSSPPGLTSSTEATAGSALPDEFPSLGSALHSSGQCRPCGWFWKPQGCQNAKDCGHCHLCPPGEVKARKKSKMAAAKRDLAAGCKLDALAAECRLDALLPPLSTLAAGCQLNALLPQLSHPLPLHLSSLVLPAVPPLPAALLPALVAPLSSPPLHSQPLPSQQPMKLPLNLAPPSPPNGSPRLTLPLESIAAPPPISSPTLELSPGAKWRSMAMACMDDDSDVEDAFTTPVSRNNLLTSAMDCLDESGSSSPPTASEPRQTRVTLELSTALLPSIGSALHGDGGCTACAWFWKPQGCANGKECPYCHLCPHGEIRRRRKVKNAALRAKALLEAEQALQANSSPSVEPTPLVTTPVL